ncbi:MAG: serine hydrolase, partial [Calditrichota bacterium]
MRIFILLLIALLAINCSSTIPGDSDMNSSKLLMKLLKSDSEAFKNVMQDPNAYRLQILYTQIDRDNKNNPIFTSHGFGVQSERYFYPASTVKLPAAALALEKLNRLNIPGLGKYTPLEIGIAYEGQTEVTEDPSAFNGKPSIANYIKKILLVSDNDAYNRLFEFIGQRQFTESMLAKGYSDSKIIRRLSVAASPEQNRITNPFKFFNGDSIIYDQSVVENPEQYTIDMLEVKQGTGYMKGGKLVNEPINFSNSNYYGIADQQAVLKALMFPEATPESQRFDLSEEDYRFLYKYMSMLPFESRKPTYAPRSDYFDSYVGIVNQIAICLTNLIVNADMIRNG